MPRALADHLAIRPEVVLHHREQTRAGPLDGPLEEQYRRLRRYGDLVRKADPELKLVAPKAGDNSVAFTQKCEWKRQGSHPFDDERQYTVTRPNDDVVFIDCVFNLTAAEDVSIKRAKHSFFAMRAASDISPAYGGTLMNSEGGINAKGTYGKPAAWCGYFGKRRFRPDVTEGIAIMNQPDNFGGNCPWFTRDYGHLSPSPFNFRKKPTTLAKGDSLKLSYRVVLFAGSPQEAKLDAVYKQWLSG